MISRLAACCFAAIAFIGLAGPQTKDSGNPRHIRADVYAGYSRIAPSPFYIPNAADQGFGFGADVNFSKWLAVAAEADWMHVKYDAEDSSHSVSILAGPRFFFPLGSHRFIIPFADVLGGALTYDHVMGFNDPFKGTATPAFAIDGGADVRIAGPLYARAQGGFLHSGFNAVYPPDQAMVKNQHSRLLVEGVWRF